MNPKPYQIISLATLACLAIGCSNGSPSTYPVSGIVQFDDGQPVRMGYVSFVPTESGPTARGEINPLGNFTLGTFNDQDGAIPGEYVVVISQPIPPINLSKARNLGPEHNKHTDKQFVVARKYTSAKTSTLICSVTAEDDNHFEFTVNSIEEIVR